MLSKLHRRLANEERTSCEGPLSLEECFTALSGMARRKTLGSDEFPMEFFLRFWSSLGADLVCVLNVAYETGQLSASQRRGLIIVLYKKNDRLETKNWCPISLLNVDYKIATRAISGRLLAVIGSVIGPDQTCGVPDRTISENLFFIRDLIEYAEQEDIPLALLSLDQEKAFDRVDWGFLLCTLEAFNFGPDFCRWVKCSTRKFSQLLLLMAGPLPFSALRGVCGSIVLSLLCCMFYRMRCWPLTSAQHLD